MKNFFEGIETREQLKSAYRKLAMKYHPDHGGDNATMAEINNQYDALDKILPSEGQNGERYQPKHREAPENFRAAVVAVQDIPDIEVELCGSWIWITGNTRPHCETFKAAGYRWSANKRAWYWHEEGYSRKGKKHYTMDEIRMLHGSEKIRYESYEQLTA